VGKDKGMERKMFVTCWKRSIYHSCNAPYPSLHNGVFETTTNHIESMKAGFFLESRKIHWKKWEKLKKTKCLSITRFSHGPSF